MKVNSVLKIIVISFLLVSCALLAPINNIVQRTPTPKQLPTPTSTSAPDIVASYRGFAPQGALARLGKGQIGDVAISQDGTLIAVGFAFGIDIYTFDTLQLSKTISTDSHVWNVSFSSNGSSLVAGLQSGAFIIVDVSTGQIVKNLVANEGGSTIAVYSPDGKTIATNGGQNGEDIIFWDPETGKQIKTLSGHANPVNLLFFSSDNSMLLSQDTKDNIATLFLWDLKTGNKFSNLPQQSDINFAAFSPDNKYVALLHSESGSVSFWDIANQKENSTISNLGQENSVLTYSPDGKFLAIAGKEIRVFDINNKNQVDSYTADGSTFLSYDKSGNTLVRANGEEINYIDINQKRVIKILSGYMYGMNSVSYSHDGRLLATTSRNGNVTLWDTNYLKPSKTLVGHTQASLGADFLQNDELLISAGKDNQLILWNVKDGSIERKINIDGDIIAFRVSPDEKFVGVLTSKNIELLDWRNGTITSTILYGGGSVKVSNFEFIPGKEEIFLGPYLSTSSIGFGNQVYSYSGAKIEDFSTGNNIPIVFNFSKDGQKMATGEFVSSGKYVVNLWDFNTKNSSGTAEIGGFPGFITYSPNGQYLACAAFDGEVYLWDVNTSKGEIFDGHHEGATGLSFSPDGSILASSSWDGSVVLWSLK